MATKSISPMRSQVFESNAFITSNLYVEKKQFYELLNPTFLLIFASLSNQSNSDDDVKKRAIIRSVFAVVVDAKLFRADL